VTRASKTEKGRRYRYILPPLQMTRNRWLLSMLRRDLERIVETNIPARLDALPWGRFHTLVVVALGVTWILCRRHGKEEHWTGGRDIALARNMRRILVTGALGQIGSELGPPCENVAAPSASLLPTSVWRRRSSRKRMAFMNPLTARRRSKFSKQCFAMTLAQSITSPRFSLRLPKRNLMPPGAPIWAASITCSKRRVGIAARCFSQVRSTPSAPHAARAHPSGKDPEANHHLRRHQARGRTAMRYRRDRQRELALQEPRLIRPPRVS